MSADVAETAHGGSHPAQTVALQVVASWAAAALEVNVTGRQTLQWPHHVRGAQARHMPQDNGASTQCPVRTQRPLPTNPPPLHLAPAAALLANERSPRRPVSAGDSEVTSSKSGCQRVIQHRPPTLKRQSRIHRRGHHRR